eukprot:1175738-Prorocentrum_minimum.AAC.1
MFPTVTTVRSHQHKERFFAVIRKDKLLRQAKRFLAKKRYNNLTSDTDCRSIRPPPIKYIKAVELSSTLLRCCLVLFMAAEPPHHEFMRRGDGFKRGRGGFMAAQAAQRAVTCHH